MLQRVMTVSAFVDYVDELTKWYSALKNVD